jgi:tripartite ATP-independent transporter DctM subunit
MLQLSIYVGALLGLLFVGLHVASILFLVAWGGDLLGVGVLRSMMGNLAWSTLNDFILVAVPIFILLGEILLRSGSTERMYRALSAWLYWLPGGLLHSNIGACALFAATSGSSVATAATIGTVALPSFRKRGYNEKLVLGSLAAGGTLGILIPPSINMIIYGAMSGTSVGRLFIGGIVPGLILTAIMMMLIGVIATVAPGTSRGEEDRRELRERLIILLDVIPTLLIFAIIMGGIYFGFATPTEAAALGLVGALVIAALSGTLNVRMLREAFRSALRTTSMVLLIILAAFLLNFVFSLLGMPQAISEWARSLGLSPMGTIWLLVAVYLVLGCFLESLSMMVTTIPIVVPLVVGLGFDPVWFGVFLMILLEMALITPPIGMNLYVVQGIRGGVGRISDIFIGTMPFIVCMMIVVILMVFFPDIALWLPDQMFD